MSFANTASQLDDNALVTGADALIQTYYFPPELIGGSSPLVKGEEEQLAWQAAAEACDSERVHFVYRVHNERVWFLAVRSADLASHSKSWCPFASLLPGMIDARPAPVIYTFYSDEAASLMAVDNDTLQIIRGTSSVIRAKAEKMSREWQNAEMVDLVPDRIATFKAVEWDSLSMREERARRFFAFVSVTAAVITTLVAVFIWFSASLVQLTYNTALKEVQDRTSSAVIQLQQTAMQLRTSDLREQLSNFNKLNEGLVGVQGWLKMYLIRDNNVKWWAVVPPNLTSDRIADIGGQTLDNTEEGTVIGNGKDAVLRKGQTGQGR